MAWGEVTDGIQLRIIRGHDELRLTAGKRQMKDSPKFAYGRASFIRKTLSEIAVFNGHSLKIFESIEIHLSIEV